MAASPDELELICADFDRALELMLSVGLRLEMISPADDPHTAILARNGMKVRLTSRPDSPPRADGLPDFLPEFILTRAGTAAGKGRAGMHYRDLIPSRLGGRYIASHILIPEGGAVPDWVHFHRIAVQLICVRNGWVRVAYEDQGEPILMAAGDMVLQPPEIRHRVLECSPGLEVVEITCPAFHETFAEYEIALPNAEPGGRDFGGQRFLRHVAAQAPWTQWQGAEAQATRVSEATGGVAEARIVRPDASPTVEVPPHDGELVFGFLLEGSARLERGESYPLAPADSFVIPPGEAWSLAAMSDDLRLLHVTTAKMVSQHPPSV
jgi:quercetin dioxygenase-like cupin family protein